MTPLAQKPPAANPAVTVRGFCLSARRIPARSLALRKLRSHSCDVLAQQVRRAVLGLGSNLGDRTRHVCDAVRAIESTPGVREVIVSPLYETSPVGGPVQGPFVNAAVLVVTDLTARDLLQMAMRIERDHHRTRQVKDGPRTLDIDILWIDREVHSDSDLVVPHPRLTQRAFALVPLLDVAADAVDPSTGLALSVCAQSLDRDGICLLSVC